MRVWPSRRRVGKSEGKIIGRKTRDSDHGDVDGSSRLSGEGEGGWRCR